MCEIVIIMQTDKTQLNELTENREFHAFLDDMAIRGMARTRSFSELYASAIRWMYGKQNADHLKREGDDLEENMPAAVMNEILPTTMQEIAVLSANSPILHALPVEDTDGDTARAAGGVLQAQWDRRFHMPIRTQQVLYDGHLMGYYVGFVYWDKQVYWSQQQQKWIGDVQYNVVNPTYFGCDPNVELAADIPVKAEFWLISYFIDKRWAVNRWPAYKRWLSEKSSEEDLDNPYWVPGGRGSPGGGHHTTDESRFDRTTGDWYGFRRKIMSENEFSERLSDLICQNAVMYNTNIPDDQSQFVKCEMFMYKDYRTRRVPAQMVDFNQQEIENGLARPMIWDRANQRLVDERRPITDETGHTIGYGIWDPEEAIPQKQVRAAYDEPLYPFGHWTIRLDGECIVEDRPYPYERQPIAVGVNFLLPHLWNGLNSVETSIHTQSYLNYIHTNLLHNVMHHGNSQWVVEEDALSTRDLQNDSEINIPNHAGGVIKTAQGKLNAVRREPPPPMPSWLFGIIGELKENIKDIKGRQNVGMGKGMKEEHTLGEVKLLQMNQDIRVSMQETSLFIFYTQIGYSMLEYISKNYEIGRWVQHLGPNRSSLIGSIKWTEGMANARYDLVLEPTSSQPYNYQEEIQRYKMATDLMGPAMYREMLEKLKIPNVDDIIQKHELLGPFEAFMQLIRQSNIPPDAAMAALQDTLAQIQDTARVQEIVNNQGVN